MLEVSCSHWGKNMIIRILALILCLAYSAFSAWDGEREGFLLGFGVGPALELVETKTAVEGENASTGHARSNFALLTDARIGYGINSRSLLFLSDFANWKKPGETKILYYLTEGHFLRLWRGNNTLKSIVEVYQVDAFANSAIKV